MNLKTDPSGSSARPCHHLSPQLPSLCISQQFPGIPRIGAESCHLCLFSQ